MKAHITKKDLKSAHNKQVIRANQFISALRSLGSKEATALADELAAKVMEVSNEVDGASNAYDQVREAKQANSDGAKLFKATMEGLLSLAELIDPQLAAKCPTLADFASVDPDYLAEKLAEAFANSGKRWQAVAELLGEGKEKRLEALKTWQDAAVAQTAVRNGRAAISELQMLNLQAEALIRRMAPPSSPAYQVFKKKKAAKHASAAPAHGTPPSAGDSTTSSTTPPAPSPTPAATTPSSGASTTVPAGASALNVVVTVPEPSVVNGVHS